MRMSVCVCVCVCVCVRERERERLRETDLGEWGQGKRVDLELTLYLSD
jgi:hypothetical protein